MKMNVFVIILLKSIYVIKVVIYLIKLGNVKNYVIYKLNMKENIYAKLKKKIIYVNKNAF